MRKREGARGGAGEGVIISGACIERVTRVHVGAVWGARAGGRGGIADKKEEVSKGGCVRWSRKGRAGGERGGVR